MVHADAGPPSVSLQPRTAPLRFAKFTLDLDACALIESSGGQVPLTRGEFALLRELVRHHGRVLSRDYLLDALAGKRPDPFDRSIDALVGRLRRKIEPDPKHPVLVVTVPGEGYRFSAPLLSGQTTTTFASRETRGAPVARSSGPTAAPHWPWPWPWPKAALLKLRGHSVQISLLVLLLLAAGAGWRQWLRDSPSADPPGLAVMPFSNLSGDPAQDYLGAALTNDLMTILATFPGFRVMPASNGAEAGPLAHVRYALRGGVARHGSTLRITAQLYDLSTGEALWADRFDNTGGDPMSLQADVADQVYQSIAGLTGSLNAGAERVAWRKNGPSLDAYDYYLRGLAVFFRFTPQDDLRARRIWSEGVARFPGSGLLRTKVAFAYMRPIYRYESSDPMRDMQLAWQSAQLAGQTADQSALFNWMHHWIMAYLYQWHDRDFARSVEEARAAVRMVPYDPMSRMDLARLIANAGRLAEAREWALLAVQQDPTGRFSWYWAYLAWIAYLSGRYGDVVEVARQHDFDDPKLMAATFVRLGRMAEARSYMAKWRAAQPSDTVAREAIFPMAEALATGWLNDLRAAGLPDS